MTTRMGYVVTENGGTKHFFPNLDALSRWITNEATSVYKDKYGFEARIDRLDDAHIDCCFYEAAEYSKYQK